MASRSLWWGLPGVGGRPRWAGILDAYDPARYTEWALKQRGYVPVGPGSSYYSGFYQLCLPAVVGQSGCNPGQELLGLDEDGFNEICFVPIGDQDNGWALANWRNTPIWDWYADNDEMRPFYLGPGLLIKADVYIKREA